MIKIKSKDYSFEIMKDIGELFNELEYDIILLTKKLTKKGNTRTFRKEFKLLLASLINDMDVDDKIAKTLMSALSSNMYEWFKGVPKDLKTKANVSKLVIESRKKIKSVYTEMVVQANAVQSQILKQSNKVATEILAEITAAKKLGVPIQDSIKSVDNIIKSFVFTDSAGKSWNPSSYMEMAARTNANVVNAEVSKNLTDIIDNDLRIIDAQSGSCPICFDFQDKIIAMHEDPKADERQEIFEDGFEYYGTYEKAKEDGFDHPNCRCIIDVYTIGVSKKSVSNDEAVNSKNYQDRQRQRAMERNIRNYKQKQAGALNEKAEKEAKAKVREWQNKLNTFAKDNNLSRMRWREQINFNTVSDGKWEKNFILGKTFNISDIFIDDVL